ncbi:30S ribosomal protein S2 [Candidatus Pacearchaeota archaeon]|nr:30S ribosomal protein S2 [Candidatus Pacearchaeota archaeon]
MAGTDKNKESKSKKESLKSLVQELNERISKDEESEIDGKKLIEEIKDSDLSEKEIEEISDKISKEDVKKEIKNIKLKNSSDKKETLIPLEDYIKCAVHLGTKVITPHMRKYVYKRRADGLAVINTALIDEKLRKAIDFLIKYEPEQVYLVCKREAGWIAAEKFQEVTGIKTFTKKYPPGITTNLALEDFFEAELTIICDPWIDKNALNDTARLKKPILSLCDTNNYTYYITRLVPCNNKSRKSIGCILYILSREYCRKKKISFKAKLEDFAGNLESQ